MVLGAVKGTFWEAAKYVIPSDSRWSTLQGLYTAEPS